MQSTEWVKPGEGDEAWVLYGAVLSTGVLSKCTIETRIEFLARAPLTPDEKEKKTRLHINSLLASEMNEYDVVRIIAAIWEYDNIVKNCELR